MFSSNQILEVSGSFDQLESALKFALHHSGNLNNNYPNEDDNKHKLTYQITEDGKYCIGWVYETVPNGWLEFPFKFNTEIVSKIIIKYLEGFPLEDSGLDGSHEKGFLMTGLKEGYSYNLGITNAFYCIVYFTPFTCFYSK